MEFVKLLKSFAANYMVVVEGNKGNTVAVPVSDGRIRIQVERKNIYPVMVFLGVGLSAHINI